jgi:oligopeptidase B
MKHISVKPPVAARKSHTVEAHGQSWEDPYFWLRQKELPEVRAYVEAENNYQQAVMGDHSQQIEQLFEEMKGRIPGNDDSVPVVQGDYEYWTRMLDGKQYAVHMRKNIKTGSEQVILDQNLLAEGKGFFKLTAISVSPNHRYLAYAFDQNGSEHGELHVRDLEKNLDLSESTQDVGDSIEWSADSSVVFYNVLDEHDRPCRVMRHRLGESCDQDQLVFEEKSPQFFVGVSQSKDERVIFIRTGAMTTTEYWWIPSDQPQSAPQVIAQREHGVEYDCEHWGGRFLITTNDGAPNFKLVEANPGQTQRSSWKTLVAEDSEVLIEAVEPFKQRVLLQVRKRGTTQIQVLDPATWKGDFLQLPESAFVVGSMQTPEFESETFRFRYESMVTPPSVYEQNLLTGHRKLLKVQKIPSGYDSSQYVSESIQARAPDGTEIPVHVIYKKGFKKNGSAPCVLYGYGSYGLSTEPGFNTSRLSLIDRGFIWAIAQIRGGSEKGRSWYENGKFLKKKNTFSDFIAAAEALVAGQFTAKKRISIYGGSAGGMLVGACINMRPDLYASACARVPFVDVINTMLDETLPLTPIEFDEWGNPKSREYFDYMLSYSPYDNVVPQEYPHLLITSGFNDPRVTYWEPTKWCAKLRVTQKSDSLILLKTDMGAGHGGLSGRYDSLKEVALIWTFFLMTNPPV